MTLTDLLQVVHLNDTEVKVYDCDTPIEIDFNKDYSNYEVVSVISRDYLLIVEVI